MNKYGPKAQKTITRIMRKYKSGKLRSGKRGSKVKTRDQAFAIGISKARQAGRKIPKQERG